MNIYFIHIPKTGGTFIQDEYCNESNIKKHIGQHPSCLSKEFIQKNCTYKWDTYLLNSELFLSCPIKFTVIRNPFDLLKSYFLSRWGDWDGGMKTKLPRNNFKELIIDYCNPSIKWHVPLMKKFLYHQLFDDNGNSQCDYAIIYDNLKEGLLELFKKTDNNYKFSNKIKNKSSTKNYKEYYDDEMINMVNKKCKNELEMFNFDFNGYKGTNYLINIKHLKLNWDTIL
jgi:hypothetical protein